MMFKNIDKYLTFRNVVILGLLVALGVTFSEVLRDTHRNFKIFAFSTQDFWSSLSPYSDAWWRHGLDFFLYSPPFNVFFTPFAYLPPWLGPFVWNVFNYCMFAWAIYLLPRIDQRAKARILLFLIPIMATSMLSFQYNMSVGYIFLFAFVLFENGNARWAMLLIMVSALTKIYGGVELLLVLFYPKFWRNVLWGLLWGAVVFCLPMVKLGVNELLPYYGEWATALSNHQTTRTFETIFDITAIWSSPPTYQAYVQAVVFGSIVAMTFFRLKWKTAFTFRVGVLALLMGYVILFSNSSEKHTYVIALAGYLYWWWLKNPRTIFDKVLYWSILVVLVLVPIDLLCPPPVMRYIFDTLDLNKWLFTVAWLYLYYNTYFKTPDTSQ